jgi:hypothetical protein
MGREVRARDPRYIESQDRFVVEIEVTSGKNKPKKHYVKAKTKIEVLALAKQKLLYLSKPKDRGGRRKLAGSVCTDEEDWSSAGTYHLSCCHAQMNIPACPRAMRTPARSSYSQHVPTQTA